MQVSLTEWEEYLCQHRQAHILQTGAWGELKSSFGWDVVRVQVGDAGVQLLFKKLPGGFSVAYIPKGPVRQSAELLAEIDEICQIKRAIFLKVEPDVWEPSKPEGDYNKPGWKVSAPIQPRQTIVIPLYGTDEELLARMKQKTRYNIRLAEKKGVTVNASENVGAFYKMAAVTSQRDGFGVHKYDYYQKVYSLFHANGNCQLLMAYFEDIPLAGLFVLYCGEVAYYMYGASSDLERNRMPAYLIQWEAMRWAKERGCKHYDLWGIPDHGENVLEEGFDQKNAHDGLWGVYRFKRGFGGEIRRSVGAWDRVYKPGFYVAYRLLSDLKGGYAD